MPEGDTIHKIAAVLRPRLVDRRLRSGRLREEPGLELAGERIRDVRAHGKHLFVDLASGRSVRSHLGMHGSWHRYAPGEPWRKPRRHASIVLATEEDVVVCFHAKEVALARTTDARARAFMRRLGPDLTAPSVDLDAVVERVRRLRPPETPVLDVLLDQELASGIGNVYKSEVLFLERVAPDTEVGALDAATLRRLYARAHELLRANVDRGARVTRFEEDDAGRLWVYGRRAEPCFVCGDPVRHARAGRHRRGTYWCAACQPAQG